MALGWKEKRKVSYLLNGNDFGDNSQDFSIVFHDDEQMIEKVLDFFKNGSEMEFPAKYIFCNIVYAYYLQKYFGEDFYERLDDRETLFDSPCPVLYSEKKAVYDAILKEVLPNIETFRSIDKTLGFFKKEFLVKDEQIGFYTEQVLCEEG